MEPNLLQRRDRLHAFLMVREGGRQPVFRFQRWGNPLGVFGQCPSPAPQR